MLAANPLSYYLGLPMWNHRHWRNLVYPSQTQPKQFLQAYSSLFNAVEGNTTFYATPSADVVNSWRDQVPAGFHFSFKLPKTISHQNALRHSGAELSAFLHRMEPLSDNLGPLMVQLPDSFSPACLGDLKRFLEDCPADFNYAVEVRHPGFFESGEEERLLNQLLQEHGVDRVCFDSRALFRKPAVSEADHDAQRKKPKLPVHALAIANKPLIRFIGSADFEHNKLYWRPWVQKLKQWIGEGKTPYVFIHTPDNAKAPVLAEQLHAMLNDLPGWQPLALYKPPEAQLAIF
jgi:uncharacterized protein YecE (DUF72 family)